jgi:hypothetical protein
MHRILLLISFLPYIGYAQEQKVLLQDYSFFVVDGYEVRKLHQSNDTLYVLHCYVERSCAQKPEEHYKIISTRRVGQFALLKLEQLDTIPLTTNPYPETRYSVLALKGIDNKQLGYLPLVSGLTKKQLDTVQTNVQSLTDKFFFTFFSEAYLKELVKLKSITTKDEAKEIVEMVKSIRFKPLIERYQKTNTKDMYNSGLTAEVLNQVCIEKGYSPIGAGRAIDQLLK